MTHFYSRNLRPSSYSRGNDERYSDFLDREEVMRYFSKTRKEMQLTSGSSTKETSCTLVDVYKNLGTLKKHPDNPTGKCDKLAKQVTDVYLVQKHPILERCRNFNKGESKKGGANIHFNADDSSVKMMMNLISSADDFCIVFGRCDYLEKIKEINLESRRNTALVVFTPKVSENVTQPRPRSDAAERVSSCAPIAEGNFSARHHFWRILGMHTARDRQQRETSC